MPFATFQQVHSIKTTIDKISTRNWRVLFISSKNVSSGYLIPHIPRIPQIIPQMWPFNFNTCIFGSNSSQMFFKWGVPKYFAIFTGKQLWWSILLMKLEAFRPTTLLKWDFTTVCFLFYRCTLRSDTVFSNRKPFKNDEKCSSFALKISKFLSPIFGHVEKRLD